MAEPRKVFRIEKSFSARLEESTETAQVDLRHAEIMRELVALRGVLTAAASLAPRASDARDHGGEVARLTGQLNLIVGAIKGERDGGKPNGRADDNPAASRLEHELKAVVSGTEQATQKILAAAEAIDSTANTLSAALGGKLEQDLAQDIRDFALQIFEACNFQDLIGQRVGKILTALKFVEDHIACVLEEIKTASAAARNVDGHPLHGPRLDGDTGHASQGDIDAMFAGGRG
jgi:chemotaxis protein CheZ